MAVIEISVDCLASAVAAERGGADRIELCSGLREGGLTPSLGLIRSVRARSTLSLFVIIRPRSGDFLYSEDEFHLMQADIAIAAQEGAQGVVLGILTADGDVDVPRTRALVDLARPLEVTFHRAFDMACDLDRALEGVIQTGAKRVLTSGGAPGAVAGRERISTLVRSAGNRIAVMAGGGVRPSNIAELARFTEATEFHSSMRRFEPSPMRYRNAQLSLGQPGTDEYSRSIVLADEVRALVHAARTVSVP